ncbi:MAG: hypothetical protein K8T25_24450 [Planctomycetia bacterium]|nr:hypothetical protein [Planctomycetia bacterium]
MGRPRLLLIGDFRHAELAPVAEIIKSRLPADFVTGVPMAIERLRRADAFYTALVLAWPRPGAGSAADLAQLRQAAPLARQFAVLGTWCEGESRSGHALPGLVRTYWHQWPARWIPDLEASLDSVTSIWTLPELASDEERLLHATPRLRQTHAGSILIASPSHETAQWLGETCRQAGYSTTWHSRVNNGPDADATAVIWDGHPERLSELSMLREQTAAPILALLDFLRSDTVREATQAGATAAMARPLLLADLYWHLEQFASRDVSDKQAA